MHRFVPIGLLLLGGCSTPNIEDYVPTPYKVDIQQGNAVTQEMVAKLKPGMTKSQVRYVLGSPPITDMFHANRWDYVYIYKKRGSVTEERKLTLFFENEQLNRVAGDVVAATSQDVPQASAAPVRAPSEIVLEKFDPSAPPKPPEDEKGWWGRMMESIGF